MPERVDAQVRCDDLLLESAQHQLGPSAMVEDEVVDEGARVVGRRPLLCQEGHNAIGLPGDVLGRELNGVRQLLCLCQGHRAAWIDCGCIGLSAAVGRLVGRQVPTRLLSYYAPRSDAQPQRRRRHCG